MKYKIWTDVNESVPTVFIHSFVGNGEDVWKAAHMLNCPPFNLVSIYDFNGDSDLSPWPATNVWKGQPPFAGKSDAHLKKIEEKLIPEVESHLSAPSQSKIMVGYSLAGLFAFWSLFHSRIFDRIACVSASFWYPGFMEYINEHKPQVQLNAVYFSLGDKESKTKHPLMKQVEQRTQEVYEWTKKLKNPTKDVQTIFEMNPGNHFTDSDKRMAKAIYWLLTL